jgi:hypothetical protein
MIDKVYLVTKGRYSDYSVYGVFVDEDIATEYAKQISDHIEEAIVDTRKIMIGVDLILPIGFRTYEVRMDRDGNAWDYKWRHDGKQVLQREADTCDSKDFADIEFKSEAEGWLLTGNYTFKVNTDKGQEGAIKIANERRVQLIAENKWPVKGEKIEI